MPLVIALPKLSRPSAAAISSPRPSQVRSAASSRRSVSRRSVRSRASQSTRTTATHSTAPSSASVSPARSEPEKRQNTNITIRHRGRKGIGITVDDRTGAIADYSDESEEDSALKFHSNQDDDGFSSYEEDDDDEEDDEEEDDLWEDYIDPTSRPHHARGQQSHRHVAPPAPPAPSVPVTQRPRQSRRTSPRHAVAAPDPHSAQHSRSRSRGSELAREHRPRHTRHRSAHQPESLEEDTGDDYPYAGPPQPQGVPPGHPSQQWAHIPPAHGYAPSTMSHHGFYPGGTASPTGPLVPNGYHGYDHYSHGNGFNPPQPNPFSPGPIGVEREGYFGGQGHGQPQGPRAGNPNRRSVGGPPSDAMMSYGQMGGHPGFQGYPPYPYGGMQGVPQVPYPGHFSQHSSPPPPEERHHSRSKRGTPRPRSVHHELSDEDHHHHQQVVQASRHPVTLQPPPPPPPPTMPIMQVIPAPQPVQQPPDTAKEDAMLKKLNDLLSGKAEEEAKKEAEERKAAELAKFARLENLLIAQQEAQIAKEKRKQQDAENAAAAAAEAKKKGDEDKLANLEKLILAQKDEQLKREAAAEAARKAAADAADAEAKKIAEEKKAAAEAAALLLEAAKKAREEAEQKAAAEAEETKKAHEKALAEAKAAAEELEKAKKAAEEEAAKLKPSDAPKAPIKFKDAVGRKFSFPWNLCKTWKGMEELIKQAFLHVDIIGPHVHQGHYDLVGPDGEIILPQVWETMIQPDWAITMHMWPMPEPPKEPPKEEAPPPPPLDHQQFMAQQLHASRSKSKKATSSKQKTSRGIPGEVVVVPPATGGAGGITPGVVVMPTPSHKPKSKPKPNGFFAWAAGGNTRSGSVKKSSKTK